MMHNATPDNTLRLLWTGGWDSTFRMLELALDDKTARTIMPIYISSDNRKSEAKEIDAMNTLLPLLRQISNARIMDLTIINKNDISPNDEITGAFTYIRSLVAIGAQYEWLARFAALFPGIEIGIEKPNGEYSGCIAAIEKTGELICRDGAYFINQDKSSKACCMLFGNFSFPLISRTETDMVNAVRAWGREDIMRGIWFCHNPIKDQPCGYCRPCRQKMECEMSWLLPVSGKSRYAKFALVSKLLGNWAGAKALDIWYRK